MDSSFRCGGGRALRVPAPPGGECGARQLPGSGRPALRLGEARRGKTLPSETSKPSSWERLMAWGSQAPGWDAVMPPGDPGTTRAAAVRAFGAASRLSGPLGRPGPASRSPTPRSQRLSRPHPGRSEHRTLECGGGRGERCEENAAFLPLSPPAPRKRPRGPVSYRVRGADPEPTAGGCAALGSRAHLLARASALSPPSSSPPPRQRARPPRHRLPGRQ